MLIMVLSFEAGVPKLEIDAVKEVLHKCRTARGHILFDEYGHDLDPLLPAIDR